MTLDNLAGFGWERPFLGVSMWVFMLGLLGFPLTGGFIGKFYVFAAAYDHGWWWLIVAGVIATMISAYYYLGIVRAMYFRDAAELQLAPAGGSPPRDPLLTAGVAIALVVTVGSFFAVQPLIDVARSAGGRAAALSLLRAWRRAATRDRVRRTGPTATQVFTAKTTSAGDERRRAERRERPGCGGRRARGAGEHEQRQGERPEERLDAGDSVVACVQERAEATRAPPPPRTGPRRAARRTRGRGSRVRPRTPRRSRAAPEAHDASLAH